MIGQMTPTEDERAEAVRQIVSGICIVDKTIASSGPILRQAIYYIWEGGEPNKWRTDRPHSAAARQARASGVDRRVLRYDHAIPLRTIRARLCEAKDSPSNTKAILRRYIRPVIIVEEEDKLLNMRFRSKMPPGAHSDDPMARYRAVGIVFDPTDANLLQRGD